MKKLFLFAALSFGAALFTGAKAQEIADNAIGLRLGGGNAYGAEISYQRALGMDNNRLELDLGWRNDSDYSAFKVMGLYQWVWNIDGNFNWYAGAGAGIGGVSDKRDNVEADEGAFFSIAGDVGIEYSFDIPLMVSLDLRPEIGLSGYDYIDDFTPDIAVGVRYQF
ncbi:hypothetical protein RM553_03330 [Zunongwangia sp. F363]|uniref:Outer membrane protein beta-barrel domain-containing protein n=1 Tax=Autumnicola tepida TaxID=3075595 RepID=A0ABU3C690_9FLAO|nr:hypothetical protein [Zunongwangia sp. F363]MDT0641857.1 hypothetical protein [Zunongwangia sp. F363]